MIDPAKSTKKSWNITPWCYGILDALSIGTTTFWNPETHIFDLLLSSVITPDFKYPGIDSFIDHHRNPDHGRLDLFIFLYKSHQITKNLLLLKSWYPGMNCL